MITLLKTEIIRSIKIDLVLRTELDKDTGDVTYTPLIYTNNKPYDRGDISSNYWNAYNEGLAMFKEYKQ